MTYAAEFTSREAAAGCSLPLVHSKGVTETPCLIAENENALLACETHFLDLSRLAQKHGIVS